MSFVEQIEGIRKGVQESHDKVQAKLETDKARRDELNDKLNKVRVWGLRSGVRGSGEGGRREGGGSLGASSAINASG